MAFLLSETIREVYCMITLVKPSYLMNIFVVYLYTTMVLLMTNGGSLLDAQLPTWYENLKKNPKPGGAGPDDLPAEFFKQCLPAITYPLSVVFGRSFVKRFALCYRSVVLSVTFVHCGQTVGRIKIKLGMQVGLGPGHIVLGGDPGPLSLIHI